MNRDDDIPPERNAFPDEVDDHADSDMPRQLRPRADPEPLSRIEAEVAGVVPETAVYGDSSYFPNADDQKDVNKSGDGEHL